LRAFARKYARVMETYDVLICPTTAQPTPPLGFLSSDTPFDVAYDRIIRYVPFTPIQNAAGAPAISLPIGRSAKGLPIGVQFASAPGHDRVLLELALAIEEAKPWQPTAPRESWLALN
jgi:amidase